MRSESLQEILQPLLAYYFSADPDTAVDIGLKDGPHARTKAASTA
jgi:hypothetical protein